MVNNGQNFVNVVCERPRQFSYHQSSQELAISVVHVRHTCVCVHTYLVNFTIFMEFVGSKELLHPLLGRYLLTFLYSNQIVEMGPTFVMGVNLNFDFILGAE